MFSPSKILLLIRANLRFLFAPIYWRAPHQANILIFDPVTYADILFRYIDQTQTQPLHIRGERINLYILIKCIIKMKVSKFHYLCEYIASASPSIIITLSDNNRYFYEIKNVFPQITTVFIQNAIRSRIWDVFSYLESNASTHTYHVDYMLTFGHTIGMEYSKYIKGAIVPIGSIKNNAAPQPPQQKSGAICLVSSYFVGASLNDQEWKFFNSVMGCHIEKVARAVFSYCEQNDLDFWIACRGNEEQEKQYFSKLVGSNRIKFCPRIDPFGSYHTIDQAKIVVSIDSSMGYESLARGNKTAIFSIRSAISTCLKFGWPATFPEVGAFWTNIANESTFVNILDYLRSVPDDEWLMHKQQYVGDLIEYDPGNTRLIKLMKEIGVCLTPEALGEMA